MNMQIINNISVVNIFIIDISVELCRIFRLELQYQFVNSFKLKEILITSSQHESYKVLVRKGNGASRREPHRSCKKPEKFANNHIVLEESK